MPVHLRSIAFLILLGNLAVLPAQDVLLETIGVVSSQGIYSAYTSIGSVADAYHGGVYTAEFTAQLMEEYANLMRASVTQLEKLQASNVLSAPDAVFIEQLLQGYQHLLQQALSYKDFLENGQEASLQAYEANRKSAWDVISHLLGLENRD